MIISEVVTLFFYIISITFLPTYLGEFLFFSFLVNSDTLMKTTLFPRRLYIREPCIEYDNYLGIFRCQPFG